MSVLKKITSAVLALMLLLGCLTGCGEKYKDAYIYFELLEKPYTLDPQTASSDSELLIVRNIYEGLMRKADDGTMVCGLSESYTYDNLTYTFKIKKDAVWSNGDPVTAYDFEYGLRRAADPKINAPFARRLFAIVNAEAIHAGNADVSELGVSAVDEHTLTITLCREDENFLKTLSTSVCMPCNQDFFNNSVGKYGLDAENIISNGSYRLSKWNKEDFGIRLYKNEKYTGDLEAKNAAVFISCIEDEAQVTRLSDGDSDMAFMPCAELESADKAGVNTQKVQNICWLMTISHEFNSEVRRAFGAAFSADVYNSALQSGFSAAKSIYPEILKLNTDGIGITPYNIDEAKSVMSAQISKMNDSKFPQSTLYYYKSDGAKELATAIVGHWQQNLSAFINIEGSDNLAVMQKEIGESSLDFALFPVTAKSDLFYEYAEYFKSVGNTGEAGALQQQALKGNCIIPVAYQTTNISYIPSLENVTVEADNGYIDFSVIIKR